MVYSFCKKFIFTVISFTAFFSFAEDLSKMQLDQFQQIIQKQSSLIEKAMNYCIENHYKYFKIVEYYFEDEGQNFNLKANFCDKDCFILEEKDPKNRFKICFYKDKPEDENIVSVERYQIMMKLMEQMNESEEKQINDDPKNILDILDEKHFIEEIEKSTSTVFVDFYSESCPPCKILSPLFDSWADNLLGKVKFVKVNIDKLKEIAVKYEINVVPTMVIFKNGKISEKKIGLPDIACYLEGLEGKEDSFVR